MLRICRVNHPECKFIDEISIALVGFANEESREMHLPARKVHSQAKIYRIGKLPEVRFSFSPESPQRDAFTGPGCSFTGQNLPH